MNPAPDLRLAELFGRYWDDALTPTEAEELDHRLAVDPDAREWFRLLVLQAVAVADLPPGQRGRDRQELKAELVVPGSKISGARWDRRHVLRYTGGALAAGIAGVALGRWLWPDQPISAPVDRFARLGSVRGEITVRTPDGALHPTDGPIPPGSTVTTSGPSASAVLFYPDGTNIAVTEDSAVTLSADGGQLQLDRGIIAADVRPPLVGGVPLTLVTTETVLTGATGAIVTLSQAATITEVGVQRGAVTVAGPTGRALGEVRGGELLTVRADGNTQKQPIRDTPDAYALDLARPRVAGWGTGWAVGHRDSTGDRPVVAPDFWLDPYYQRQMYQIRSDKQWTRGYFRLHSDSVVRVRYRVERSGPGQICFCVRTPDVRSPDTGMLEWNGTYAPNPAVPGGWQTIEVRAGAMLNNKHAPKFGPSWIGFLIIFNTYESDLRLQVAEFRVSPSEAPA